MTPSVTVVRTTRRVIVTPVPPRKTVVRSTRKVIVRTDTPTTRVVRSTRKVVVRGTGAQGPPGAGSQTIVIAAQTIQAYSVVAVDSAGMGYPPDKDNLGDAFRVLGIATTAALALETVVVATDGLLNTRVNTWTLGPLYLGDDGALTSTPVSTAFHLQVASAVAASELLVRPQFPIFLV